MKTNPLSDQLNRIHILGVVREVNAQFFESLINHQIPERYKQAERKCSRESARREHLQRNIRSCLKIIFWPHLGVGASF